MVTHDPSKVEMWVRFPYSAHRSRCPNGIRGMSAKHYCAGSSPAFDSMTCRIGEIGRHSRLKICRPMRTYQFDSDILYEKI